MISFVVCCATDATLDWATSPIVPSCLCGRLSIYGSETLGRTPKPLFLLVAPELLDKPEVVGLREKGHRVEIFETEADLILHSRAWQTNETLIKYLDLAIKAARGVRYPKKVKK